ncbi:matrix-remodeling-associated protein 7 isoform X2 [Denticeps clupeoides]|uniref:matrix-remodeling-associated protein 7 isoform X2 n=1 Tax=Denticeps clupeoides TaxID=299321 RepID=UPI0010A2FF21|nr:matrix-remodeling-associated protein 7-like isoform X2 [Denticeps clupeoides]
MDFSFWTAIVFTLLAFVVGLSLLRGNRSKRESDGQSGEVGVGGGSERNATRNKSEDDWMTDSTSAGTVDKDSLTELEEKCREDPRSSCSKAICDMSLSGAMVTPHLDRADLQADSQPPRWSCDVEPVINPSEEQPLRYIPGMLRTSQLERLMSHEELDEERRVQRQQLAAIFQLLKENQETFGEVTERDMEEQLKLYSI